ncbi:CHAT domain-containing protein [Corallococcus sp. M34]|uniref:CHAT domain-containing protein n=1 Tax=Citreicoccus inhibens TaxID=2849499 RepID=UPI001C23C8AE|nr:CHAT domain-containing protein [Citreicoccus inhibens]MBU8895565.1 CHAT domain-containing protein [Citreicoccus inhibens]
MGLVLMLAVGAGLVRWGRAAREHEARVGAAVWRAEAATRLIEARVSLAAADAYRPYGPMRAEHTPVAPLPLQALARLESQGDMHGLAAAYLVRGDAALAAPYLEKAEASPDVDCDRALLALDRRDLTRALTLLDGVLRAHPRHAQALWNRGLVLRELELWASAAESFEAVAALGETGWSQEARALAQALRERLASEREGWNRGMAAGKALVAGTGTVPTGELRAHPGFMRMYLYEAIRAAGSIERLRSLAPMAEALDARFGGTALGDALRWAEARDFRVRAPLAERYRELALKRPVPGGMPAFLAELRRAGERDLLMGALVTNGEVAANLEEYASLARDLGDPWFVLLAEQERAAASSDRGLLLQAEQVLRGAVATCKAQPLGYRCGPIYSALAELYRQFHRVPEAIQAVESAQAAYRSDGSWSEVRYLMQLGQLARFQKNAALAVAYLGEVLLRRPEDCATRQFVRANDAYALLRELDVKGARASMGEALSCPGPLSLVGADTLADLARLSPDAEQDARLVAGLEARLQDAKLPPGQRVLARYIQGNYLVGKDRAQGEALLRRAVDEARQLPDYNVEARKARAYSQAALLYAAGRAGDFARAEALFGEELGASLPGRCSLAISADLERTLVVMRGPDGSLRGDFDASRTAPLGEEVRGLVPTALVDALRPCERVEVVARPPLHGRAGLLPEDIAWAYYGAHPAVSASPAGGVRRLVVANVEAPPELGLPPLGIWRSSAQDVTLLSGAEATPGHVLESMADATEIEIHAHGLVNPSLSEASLLVLSPEPGGHYALTAGEVRAARLRGQPLVILGACRAARSAPWMYERFSLPTAFIEAGARTVLAATVDVPDAEAAPFFDAVRGRIEDGRPAAIALRDTRLEWMAHAPSTWARSVLVFD